MLASAAARRRRSQPVMWSVSHTCYILLCLSPLPPPLPTPHHRSAHPCGSDESLPLAEPSWFLWLMGFSLSTLFLFAAFSDRTHLLNGIQTVTNLCLPFPCSIDGAGCCCESLPGFTEWESTMGMLRAPSIRVQRESCLRQRECERAPPGHF